MEAKFNVDDLVLYYDGVFRVREVFTFAGLWCYKLGTMPHSVQESLLKKADFRDVIRITKHRIAN